MATENYTLSCGWEGDHGGSGAGGDHPPDLRPEEASAGSAISRMGDEAESQEGLAAERHIAHLSALTVSFSR